MSERSYSYSGFSAALQCLQKYKLVYIDKLQGDESGDLAFGTAMHSAVNAILEGEDGEVTFSTHWEALKDKEMVYGRFKHGDLWNIGLNFVSKFARMHAPKFKPFSMEQRLYSEYKGVKLEGTADYAGDYEGVPTLMDFKTTGYPYKQEKGLVALQLNLYAYLVIKELKYVPKQLGYYPFVKATGSIQKPILIPFDEAKMYNMLDEMLEYITKLELNNSYPKNYNACIQGTLVCPFLERCHGPSDTK